MGHRAAMAAQALALLAVGLVLVVAALTAPAAAEPAPLRWRPATAQERESYDARRLGEALEEYARQQDGATAAPTAVTPDSRTRTTR